MIFQLHVEHMKDATKKTKRAVIYTLRTDIPGMERMTAVGELPKRSVLGKEVDKLITQLLEAKKAEIKANNKQKTYERKKSLQKNG